MSLTNLRRIPVLLVFVGFLTACGGGGGGGGNPPGDTGDDGGGDIELTLSAVTPLYPKNGVNWNDYVKNDGGDVYSATDLAADGSETGGYSAVIHGGEKRVVTVTGVDSCDGVTATDSLDAFDWTCVAGPVRVVSTGLKEGKNLSDLIDFSAPGWKSNSVTVTKGASSATTSSSVWWNNDIIEDNNGGSLTDVGTVYVVTENPFAAYTIGANKVALVVKPGVTLTGSASAGEHIIFASLKNFLWIEGKIDATGNNTCVAWGTVKFSVLRNLDASNADTDTGYTYWTGVFLVYSSNNSLSNITAANNGENGVRLDASSDNSLSNITAANNGGNGVRLENSSDNNSLSNIKAANNVFAGIFLNSSSNNRLSDVTAFNNDYGVDLVGSSNNNSLLNITASNNASYGVSLDGSSYNSLSNVTAANNGETGVSIGNSSYNSLSNVIAANNRWYGVYLWGNASYISLSNITATNNDTGVYLENSWNNIYFTGLLKVGNNTSNDCYVDSDSSPAGGGLDDDPDAINGTHDGLCIQDAPSDFGTATTGVSLATSFVGRVTTDDTVNTSDFSGTASSYPADPTAFDWLSFDNSYRGWGKDGLLPFPNADHLGRWTTGTGRIWDWSLALYDTGDPGPDGNPGTGDDIPAIESVLTVPDGNDTIMHNWTSGATTYLRNAVEIIGTGGNDNGLCESGETCLFTPNIGSYQGHGTLQSAGTIGTGGTVENITLMEYPTKGYE